MPEGLELVQFALRCEQCNKPFEKRKSPDRTCMYLGFQVVSSDNNIPGGFDIEKTLLLLSVAKTRPYRTQLVVHRMCQRQGPMRQQPALVLEVCTKDH
jgi:hypothetical protein